MSKYSLILVKHETGYSEPEEILKFKGFNVLFSKIKDISDEEIETAKKKLEELNDK